MSGFSLVGCLTGLQVTGSSPVRLLVMHYQEGALKNRDLLESRKTNKHYTFQQWLGLLDHAFLTIGFKGRVVRQTGEDCWREYYDDGYTAEDAMIADLQCA